MKLVTLAHDVSTSSLRNSAKGPTNTAATDRPYYMIQNQEPPRFMSGRWVLQVLLLAACHTKDTGVHFRVGTEAQTTRKI